MATVEPADTAFTDDDLRSRILSEPEVILEDHELMRTLVAASERSMGTNIVDLRGMAMERLESKLDRLETTHKAVIAAAYENLSSTSQIHRAILRMLDPDGFEGFLQILDTEVAEILRVQSVRLVLESARSGRDPALERLREVLQVAEPGFCALYMTGRRFRPGRQVMLRHCHGEDGNVHGTRAATIGSEAMMFLDLGENRLPGMLVLGAEDPRQFQPSQATDLLSFFAGVFERTMRRWLS